MGFHHHDHAYHVPNNRILLISPIFEDISSQIHKGGQSPKMQSNVNLSKKLNIY